MCDGCDFSRWALDGCEGEQIIGEKKLLMSQF